jgi:glycosyltransferase involved in cell wall biosynthesis
VFDASDTTLAWMYENCKALVFPSLSEGFGIPPLEALSYKKPVVAAKTSSIPEILGDEACWFDPTNEVTLFEALLNVDKQKVFNESVLKKYSWTVAAKSTRNLYQSVL